MNISIFSREINSTFWNMKEFKDFLVSLNKIFIGIWKPNNILNLKIEKFIEDLSILKEKYKKNDLDELNKKYDKSYFSCEEIEQIKVILEEYKENNIWNYNDNLEYFKIIEKDLLILRGLINGNIKENEVNKQTLETFKNLNTKEKADKLKELTKEEKEYNEIINNFKEIDSVLEKIESFRIKFNEAQKNKTEEVVEITWNQVVEIIEEKPENEIVESIVEEKSVEEIWSQVTETIEETTEINKLEELTIEKTEEEKQEIILSEEEKIINEINSLNSKNNNDEIIDKVLELCELEFDKEKLKEILATKIYLNSLKKEQNEKIIRIQEYIYWKKIETKKEINWIKNPIKKIDYSISVANKLKNIEWRKKYLEDLKETENFDKIYEYLKELRNYQLFPLLSLEIIELLVNKEKEYELNSFFNAIREKWLKTENPDFTKFWEKCVQLEEIFWNKILNIKKVWAKVEEIIKEEKKSEIWEEIIVKSKEEVKTQILSEDERTEIIEESLEELENEKKWVILSDKEIDEIIDESLKNIDIFVNLKKFAEEKNISWVYSALFYAYNLWEKIDIKEIEKILKKLFEDTKNTENKKDLEYINELKYLFGEIYFK